MTSLYRYCTVHALTGEVLARDLPMSDVEFGPALSAAGSFQGTVAPRLAHLVRSQLAAGTTLLVVERDRQALWGGIIWRGLPAGSALSVEASGPGSYPFQRYDLHGNLGGRGPYVHADPCRVIRDAWDYLQQQPDGNLRVAVDATTSSAKVGTPADPYDVPWWEESSLGSVIEDMTAVEGGPEWTEGISWSSAGKAAMSIRLGWPRLGRRRTDITFSTGVNIVGNPLVEYDADQAAQVVIALGAGQGRSRRRAIDAARDGKLRLEHVLDAPGEKANDRLAARARAERIARQVVGDVPQITVIDHPSAHIGSWQIGDDVSVRVHNEWTTFTAWCRIVGWQIRPGAADGPDQADLQLRRADRFNYSGGMS
ncbi:hypothetical protein [Streptomyces sp. NPDC091278]|uniref:hypothetical protein n=1 Tax=Streptomyces sp. NPDC091278 TaxID=3155301 RepID=UPI00344D8574